MTLVSVGTTLLVLALCHEAAAQSSGFIGLNAGGSYESAEDGVSGSAGGAGLGAGLRLREGWTAAVDVWVPGYIEEAGGRHRDILVSIVAVREAAARDRARPYVLAGISFGHTTSTFTSCLTERQGVPTIVDCTDPDVQERRQDAFASTTVYAVVGTGLDFPLWRRVHLAPEARVLIAVGSVIIRPALGIRVAL